MALVKCLGCGVSILTEADIYLVVPHSSGYHPFCFDCTGFEPQIYYNIIKEKTTAKTDESTEKRAQPPE